MNLDLNPLDYILLRRRQWRRFEAVAKLPPCLVSWQQEESRLLLDCYSADDAADVGARLNQLCRLAWIILGVEDLAVYCGNDEIWIGSTVADLESNSIDFDPIVAVEDTNMPATLDREKVEQIAVEQFQQAVLEPEIDSIADEAVERYLQSPDFEQFARTRLNQCADRWRNLLRPAERNSSATATIEPPAAASAFQPHSAYHITLFNALQMLLSDPAARQPMLTQIRKRTKKGQQFIEQILQFYPEQRREKARDSLTSETTIDRVSKRFAK